MQVQVNQESAKLGTLTAANGEVQICVELVGELTGDIKLLMDQETARKIASTMMLGLSVSELDEMAKSAICELANIIAGNAATDLAALGLNCDISPPSFLFWDSAIIDTGGKSLTVSLSSDIGAVRLGIRTHRVH